MLLSLWIVLALGVFAVGCGAKALRYLRMPMHVRWELYPVAHEKGRAHYGGSYFEEVDWWTKPREVEKLAEVRTILEEVLTLKAVREHNRPLWLPSLLFHYGLYALCLLGLALAAGAVAIRLGLPAGPLAGGAFLSLVGALGIVAWTLGAALLLRRRTADPELRVASTPADFLHLVLLLALFLASAGSWLWADRTYATASAFLASLLGAGPRPDLPLLFAAQLVLLGLFLVYLPFSHMTHFFTKYFTWHSVRWDDAPNLHGEFDAKAGKLLVRPIGWSASHIGGGDGRTWADVVTKKGGA